ncbi:OmpA/MotB family protein [Deinococcus depolymerans]|uniref:OmpA family protein n=1 Tax=Deinococcus depolymerans TaxID=392408 RepID=A0ABN1CCF5_9DEIO
MDDDLNPFIAFSDLMLNLALILVFFVVATILIGRAGWEEVRYKDAQKLVRAAVQRDLPRPLGPSNTTRLDPPGAQRWVFQNETLFQPGTSTLTEPGRAVLAKFARIICRSPEWRRIRVEGHTKPIQGQADEWELSAARAAQVAKVLANIGRIRPYHLAVAGRAGQAPVDKKRPDNPENERVELLLEFVSNDALPSPCIAAAK